MMNRRDFSLRSMAALGLCGAGVARAQGTPTEGQNFVRLASPAPVSLPPDKKIDVVEFFWYGCPHCNALEPLLENWQRRLTPDVSFRRVHVGFGAIHQVHQKLFYALEETGQLAALHKKVFAAMHQQGKRLATEAEIGAFIKDNGGDSAKFVDSYRGFGVHTKATRARQLSEAYKIDGVPALGIQGRFYTSASLPGNGSHERMLAVADFLIQRARQG
jgi:thiol:disulfide interchange protein DsbA